MNNPAHDGPPLLAVLEPWTGHHIDADERRIDAFANHFGAAASKPQPMTNDPLLETETNGHYRVGASGVGLHR